jgi:hypothetical protein
MLIPVLTALFLPEDKAPLSFPSFYGINSLFPTNSVNNMDSNCLAYLLQVLIICLKAQEEDINLLRQISETHL